MIFTNTDILANAKSEEVHNCTKCDIQLKMTSRIQKFLTNPIRIRIIFKITGFAFNREVLLVWLGLMAEPAKPAKAGARCLSGPAELGGKILNT